MKIVSQCREQAGWIMIGATFAAKKGIPAKIVADCVEQGAERLAFVPYPRTAGAEQVAFSGIFEKSRSLAPQNLPEREKRAPQVHPERPDVHSRVNAMRASLGMTVAVSEMTGVGMALRRGLDISCPYKEKQEPAFPMKKMIGTFRPIRERQSGVKLTARPLPDLQSVCTTLTGPANAAALHRMGHAGLDL